MIIIEAIINTLKAVFKPVIKGLVWIITARDCEHCKHSKKSIFFPLCIKNGKICYYTDCYNSITCFDFERNRHQKEG